MGGERGRPASEWRVRNLFEEAVDPAVELVEELRHDLGLVALVPLGGPALLVGELLKVSVVFLGKAAVVHG